MTPMTIEWPKQTFYWRENNILCASVPFTWELPKVRMVVCQKQIFDQWEKVIVGGPAVQLMPDFFSDLDFVEVGKDCPGILQRINPQATRTTTGCPNKCKFCGIGTGAIECGGFRELEDWPDNPILCDNNFLASSPEHFDRVIDRLEPWGWADFNQGLDIRLLTPYHAKRLKRIGRPIIRLALDSMALKDKWLEAYEMLRSAGFPKSLIKTYALIGFNAGPDEAWERCRFVDDTGTVVLPMWFHALDQLEPNTITEQQANLGWSDYERRRIMQWFYWHKKAVA